MPDLVLIDGGAGQFSAARTVLADLGITDVKLVAIAKGPDRDAGREWFHTGDKPPFQLPPRDPVLYFLQRLRDEAHRFAISTHRASRSKAIVRSELDEIPGIGAARSHQLHPAAGSGQRNHRHTGQAEGRRIAQQPAARLAVIRARGQPRNIIKSQSRILKRPRPASARVAHEMLEGLRPRPRRSDSGSRGSWRG